MIRVEVVDPPGRRFTAYLSETAVIFENGSPVDDASTSDNGSSGGDESSAGAVRNEPAPSTC